MSKNYICQICTKSVKSIGTHLRYNHPKFTSKTYYDKFFKIESEGTCLRCTSNTRFLGVTKGYRNYCSTTCSNNHEELNLIRTANHIEAIKNNPDIYLNISKKLKAYYELRPEKLKEFHNHRDKTLKNPEKEEKRKARMSISKRNFYKKLQTQENSFSYVLYIIKHNTKPIVKIGMTKDIKRRLKDISKAFGESDMVFSLDGSHSEISLLESNLHEHFNERCEVQPKGYGRTEWFCSSILNDIFPLLKEFRVS